MASIKDAMAYLCQCYPYKSELSKARVNKMLYLSDWRSAITRGTQITDINWKYNWHGPYVDEVWSTAQANPGLFQLTDSQNIFGSKKQLISAAGEYACPSLSKEDRDIINFVILHTKSKNWDEFIKLVYSTYPIVTQPRGSYLNLVDLARNYARVRGLIAEDGGSSS
ncbi:Panacea domain-containing protein [Sorangium sp. So ce542]|uniref:Panacea domain-containing protein n=1 Tax=Sorangium sp. So ce542 TaxID=3133316 RepID=UPI003F5E5448